MINQIIRDNYEIWLTVTIVYYLYIVDFSLCLNN